MAEGAVGGVVRGRALWPTVLFTAQWAEHERHRQGLIEHFLSLRDRAERVIDSGVGLTAKPERGLFESRFDLFETSEHPDVLALVAFLDAAVRDAVWQINGRAVDPGRLRVKWDDSWFHITNDGGFHDAHYHSACSWCGIYYVRAGEAPASKPSHAPNGVNRFYSPFVLGGTFKDYGNAYLEQTSIDVPPRDGMVVLFPSYLLHSALPYRGAEDRIVVAFNTSTTLAD